MAQSSKLVIYILGTSLLLAILPFVESDESNTTPGNWPSAKTPKYPAVSAQSLIPYLTQGQMEYIKGLLVGINDTEVNQLHGNFLEQMPHDDDGDSASVQQKGFVCAGYRPYPSNPSYYLEFNGVTWVLRFCRYGYFFDINKCFCSAKLQTSVPTSVTTTTQGFLTTVSTTKVSATSNSASLPTTSPSTTIESTTTFTPFTIITEPVTSPLPVTTTDPACAGFRPYLLDIHYYLWDNGMIWAKKQCPPGLGFDYITCSCSIWLGTTASPTTTTMVPTTTQTEPTTTQICAGFRPYLLDVRYYLQYDGVTWVRKSCLRGFGFDYVTCSCSIWLGTPSPSTTTPLPTTTTTRPRSTTTRPRPTTDNSHLVICGETVVLQGAGFAPLPGTCDAYILCRFMGDVPISLTIKRCPNGLQWNQDKLTCDYAENVRCVSDRNCQNRKAIPGDKQGFMQQTGNGWVRMPCPSGFSYNKETCGCTEKLNEQCRDKKPASGNPRGFLQFNGASWIFRPCPRRLIYNPYSCLCMAHGEESDESDDSDEDDEGNNHRRYSFGRVDKDVCRPSLKLNFNNDKVKDLSPNRFLVRSSNVSIKNNKGYFNGTSKLTIPDMSYWEFGSTVYIFMKYKHSSFTSQQQQTLVTNGDGQTPQSIGICSGKESVDFYAETKEQPSTARVTVPATNGTWRYLIYKLNEGHLQGYTGKKQGTRQVKGPLQKRPGSLIIGGGGSCGNFQGVIQEIQVFICKPNL